MSSEGMAAASPTSFSATGKVIAILDVVAQAAAPLTLSQIGLRIGVSKSTVHRIVRLLEVHAMVRREADGYVLGDKPYGWSQSVRSQYGFLIRHSVPRLVGLHARLNMITSLGVLTGADVLYLHSIYRSDQAGIVERTSERVAAHWTALGKVLLAYTDFDQIAGRGLAPLAASTPETITSPGRLTMELARIRSAGYAVSVGEYLPGIASISAPIKVRDRVLAAVSVAGPAEHLNVTVARPLVHQTAGIIQAQLERSTPDAGMLARFLPAS